MPTSSTTPDINYLSVAGDQSMPAQRDFTMVDGSLYATVVKLSDGIHDQVITGLKVNNGNETSVDLDICKNMIVQGEFGLGPVVAQTPLRAKGHFQHIAFAGTLHSRGTRWGIDIELGDWMDQDYGISHTCDLTGILPHADGKGANTVAIGWVMPFTVKLGPNCRKLFWASLGMKAYVLAKFVIRFILRIPKGTKGPAWF